MYNLKKLRFLFFIPVWGVVINFFYINKNMYNDSSFSKKNYTIYQFLIVLTFFLGFVFSVLIMRIINNFVNIRPFFTNYGVYVGFIFAGYLINFPCIMYIRKHIENK